MLKYTSKTRTEKAQSGIILNPRNLVKTNPKVYKALATSLKVEKRSRDKDRAELNTTGNISNPISNHYRKDNISNPLISQDNIAPRQRLLTDNLARNSEKEDSYLRNVALMANAAQTGHFIPHPTTQGAAVIGDAVGAAVASRQAYKAYKKGDYIDAAVNTSGVILPAAISKFGFTRNTKWSPLSRKVDKILGNRGRTEYVNLTERVKGQSRLAMAANKTLAAGVVAETAYEAGAPFNFKKEGLKTSQRKRALLYPKISNNISYLKYIEHQPNKV